MTTVNEIMTRHFVTVSPETPVNYVARVIADIAIKIVPVCDKNRLCGVVSERDIVTKVVARDQSLKRTTAKMVMDNSILEIPSRTDIVEAAKLMATNRVDCLAVVDNKKLVGLLTMNNLLKVSIALASMVLDRLEITSPTGSIIRGN